MSRRSGASRSKLHVHCNSCYSRRCRARVEASESCSLVPCRLLCGALFHICKEEDHLLLCPNVREPCINAEYGCSAHMLRSSRAAHLQVCPASVVCCSMEWNRWPADDAHSHMNPELHENLLREREQGGCLDLAMALKDQDRLFHSLKMKKLFPELINIMEEEEESDRKEEERKKEKQKKAILDKEKKEGSHTWEPFSLFTLPSTNDKESEMESEDGNEAEPELTQEEREAIARNFRVDGELLEHYNMWERMFSMEMGGCREAGGAAASGRGKGLGTVQEEDTAGALLSSTATNTCCPSAEVSVPSSSRKSPSKFAYGRIEPMKIVTIRSFQVPTSFHARQSRIRNPGFYKKLIKAVDTSDLGVAQDQMPVWEEVQASLLCSLEKEQRGHLIAETVFSDALLQDVGTQTYSFLSAPFPRNTSLADLTAERPLELHLQLQVESVTSRHHKVSSAFTFLCGHVFQRREHGKHYKNIHSDIQMGVNGWFEQRCPLAYLGCTFSQRRFTPSTQKATVSFNENLGCFSLHPTIHTSLEEEASQPLTNTADPSNTQRRRRTVGQDSLSSLPYEVLCHMARFLDSLSLSQLALVSRLMRQVCSSLLQDRGMVTLHWERKSYSHRGTKWMVKQKVWQFSTLFSPVDTWHFSGVPSISEHLKVCPYYEKESRTEKIRLPRVQEEIQTSRSCRAPTLVSLFQQKRMMM
ncbi:F-box protein 40.1 [Gouania willdenowi]|uniref:F-box only protein 40-like n=1 Tax=Gouania willdenowi TaxID=441366 RepID=A0A8C5N8A5_GOUWI|nr:F-box only protein 40-like [Gouania willdenowi]